MTTATITHKGALISATITGETIGVGPETSASVVRIFRDGVRIGAGWMSAGAFEDADAQLDPDDDVSVALYEQLEQALEKASEIELGSVGRWVYVAAGETSGSSSKSMAIGR